MQTIPAEHVTESLDQSLLPKLLDDALSIDALILILLTVVDCSELFVIGSQPRRRGTRSD